MSVLDNPQNQGLQEDEVPYLPQAVRAGLIGGLIMTAINFLSNMTGLATSGIAAASMLSLVVFVVYIGWAYLTASNHRKNDLGGFMSFKRAFLLIFVTYLIMSMISVIFNYIYMTIIDPDYSKKVMDATMDMMKGMNVPEDKLEEAFAEAEKNTNPMKQLTTGMGMSVALSVFFGLIMAAIMKKNKPTFA